jgi:hypothetical protein
MQRLASLNLIQVFDYYLILGFILGTALRVRQYGMIFRLLFTVPKRWPKMLQLAREHKTLFLTWRSILPIALTFTLMLAHTLALRLVWYHANVTPETLGQHWPALIIVTLLGGIMLYSDLRAIFLRGQLDQAVLERDLDRAEYWLRSWVAPALKYATFGFLNPRRMVSEEVRKAIVDAALNVNQQMWLWSLQISLRLFFGLSLWLTWAWTAT